MSLGGYGAGLCLLGCLKECVYIALLSGCLCPRLPSPLACRPMLIDMNKVYRQTNLENLDQAFSVAERDLGVTRLLDPEGMNYSLAGPIFTFTA